MPTSLTELTPEQQRAVDDEVQKALDLVVTVAARLSQLTERLDRLEGHVERLQEWQSQLTLQVERMQEEREEERLTPDERKRLEAISARGRAKNIHKPL